jgi:hypothetical protein
MSTPLPAMAVKLPPTKPVRKRTAACQNPKSGMVSNVFRLCCLSKHKVCFTRFFELKIKQDLLVVSLTICFK